MAAMARRLLVASERINRQLKIYTGMFML